MENQEQNLISLNKVSFGYDKYKVFTDLNIDVVRGNHIAILGKSGTGKSTLLKLLSGLLIAKSGQIEIKENLRFSFLFQDNTLLPWMTIMQNIKFFSKKSTGYIENILNSLKIKDVANKYPEVLSGGMLQRANLACSLAVNPDVLLMDEPFSSLDYLTKLDNYEFLIKEINKSDITTVIVTHDINEAILFSKYIYIISGLEGKIIHKIKIDKSLHKVSMMTDSSFLEKYNNILKLIKS